MGKVVFDSAWNFVACAAALGGFYMLCGYMLGYGSRVCEEARENGYD